MNHSSWRRDLVLLGGGHSHALALRMLAMRPDPHTRVSLVSLGSHSPYSGMLPGLLAGHYAWEEAHIDLDRLCSRSGVRFISARALGVDPDKREVILADRPALPFDVLSIDIGSQPGLGLVPGAVEYATPVKPVHSFYQRWQVVEQRLDCVARDVALNVVLVGGGAGSVELALAMRHRTGQRLNIKLICGAGLLEGYHPRARQAVRRKCLEWGIELSEDARVVAVSEGSVLDARGVSHSYDELFWCTAAVAEGWLKDTAMPCDAAGFLQVSDTLQVLGYPHIFAAGDVATQQNHPRPKAGVYAVRQAPVLAHNLLAYCRGEGLREHRPQRQFLSLLSLGDKFAVADRGVLSASGGWVWAWKDRIDRKFMALFDADLPAMPTPGPSAVEEQMHCGGCGAKLPGDMLRQGLRQLVRDFPGVVDAQQLSEDAALLDLTPGTRLLQSIDVLRALVDDPWLMGRIAVLHALSDLYAMGARPHSALASLTMPYAGPLLQQRDLQQLMSGAVEELGRADCRLLGGHTMEGPELTIGFTVNGELQGAALGKHGVQPGDQLILCKPLGTGVLFAARQQGKADGRWINSALDSMLHSNATAAGLAREHAVHAATDITGFGFLGHLAEMLQGGPHAAQIELSRVPCLPGVAECFAAGVASTLQPGNIASVSALLEVRTGVTESRLQVLFDPQTSGGLLLSVAAGQSAGLVAALQAAGFAQAAVVGEVVFRGADNPVTVCVTA